MKTRASADNAFEDCQNLCSGIVKFFHHPIALGLPDAADDSLMCFGYHTHKYFTIWLQWLQDEMEEDFYVKLLAGACQMLEDGGYIFVKENV